MAKYKLSCDGNSVVDTEEGVTIPIAPGNRHYGEYREWLSQGNVPDQYVPSQDEILAEFTNAVQDHIDAKARELGYDSIYTAASYADEPAVPQFQKEGRALRAWRSLVWAKCHEVLNEAMAGTREIPTQAELLPELPALVIEE